MSAPSVSFVAWTPVGGRSRDIASALGGESWVDYDPRLRGWRTPYRYLRSGIRQFTYLWRTRPERVIATNPPIFCGLVAHLYARATGGAYILDSHPTGFGFKDNRLSQLLQPLHRVLARRAAAVLVTDDSTADIVRRWGGNPLLVHEPPAGLEISERPPRLRPLIAFIGTFASDEPVDAVVEAARALPSIDVSITGDLTRAPTGLVERAPVNVHFTGWLDQDEYRSLLRSATAVLTLTLEPTSVMRSAYEAVYAGRPVIVTDTPVLRELFPHAVFTANDSASLSAAMRRVVDALPELDARTKTARSHQVTRWEQQLDSLRRALDQPL